MRYRSKPTRSGIRWTGWSGRLLPIGYWILGCSLAGCSLLGGCSLQAFAQKRVPEHRKVPPNAAMVPCSLQPSPLIATNLDLPQLVKEVAANELADRAQPSYWMYRVQKRMEQQTLISEQIETSAGPVYRLLAIDGKPLDQEQRQQEEARLDAWLRDTAEQKRAKKEHDDNDQRLQRIMGMLPDAFLYEANGWQGACAKVKFRPNPAYVPPTYEARMLHGLEGEMWIDVRQKRLAHASGELIDKVEFGYGLLGHLDKGGTFALDRQQVGSGRWRMQRADVHISGRLLFLKTLNRLQHEERSDFHPVPSTLTLTEASDLLRKVTLAPHRPPGGQ